MSGTKGAPVIEVKDLNISFKTAAGVIKVVENVSFAISKGECLAVVGESGSGKSVSALATIGLLVKDQSIVTGSVIFRGEELLGKPESYMRKVRGGGISMIFQEPLSALNPVTTIGEQIAEVLVAHGRAGWREANKKAIEYLELVEIAQAPQRVKQYPHQLSGGMRQRAMIAMALAGEPELIIADEATTGLDLTVQAQILDLLKAEIARRNAAAIIVTHDLDLVACHATRVIAMREGSIVFDGTPASLLENDSILRACSLRRPPAAELAWLARQLGFTTPPVTCRRDLESLEPTMPTTMDGSRLSLSLKTEPIVDPVGAVTPRGPLSIETHVGGIGPGALVTWLERRNPTVKFGVVITLGFMMTFVFNPLTPLAWLAVVMVVAWTTGIGPHRLARLLGPVMVFAFSLLWTNAFLASVPQGEPVLWQWGPFHLTVHGLVQGLALALRGVSTAAVGLLFILTTDPALLVVSLVQHGRLPYRWGYALLAGYRFMPGLADELVQIRLARRVRGEDVTDERGIYGSWGGGLRRRANGVSRPFRELRILLTVAILRATRLAIAMDARGFAGISTRTYFHTAPLVPADFMFAGASLLALALVNFATSWVVQITWVPPS